MKPTHILVPIEYADIARHSPEDLDYILSSSPKVDLSEEGIKAKAEVYTHSVYQPDIDTDYVIRNLRKAYQQCAKDLLNQTP